MITIIGRRLIIPDCDRILGVVGDKNTPVKIKLSENTLESYLPGAKSFGDVAIILKLEHETATVTVPPILCVHDKDGVYVGDLSILSSVKSGLVSAQAMIVLPGSATDDTALDDAESIWQSDEDYFYIADDIELKSFSNSSDTYKDFQNLLAAVGNKVIAAESAKDAAETAKEAAETAESNAEGAEGRINETVKSFNEAYGDFSLQAEKAKEHYDSRSNPHKVTAEQVGAYSKYEVDLKVGSVAMLADNVDSRLNNHEINHQNPHKVTAEQVGAYTKEEVDEKFKNVDVDVDLSEYVKKKEVFETGSFAWTDFEYTLPSSPDALCSVVDDKIFIGGTGEPVIIHCAGKTLGFTFSISGYGDAEIKINGETTVYTDPYNDGREFASDVVIPLTYMESDIVFSGGMKTWTFTDMTIQSIKGIGNIDKALDSILDIQNVLIGGDV